DAWLEVVAGVLIVRRVAAPALAVAEVVRADVAVVGARRAGRLVPVRRAARVDAVAELRHVALDVGGPADPGPAPDRVRRAVVARAVAPLGDVARSGGGAADRRALRVIRALRAAPGARLGDVADAGRGAADGARGQEGVGRTAVARAVAALRDVARTG